MTMSPDRSLICKTQFVDAATSLRKKARDDYSPQPTFCMRRTLAGRRARARGGGTAIVSPTPEGAHFALRGPRAPPNMLVMAEYRFGPPPSPDFDVTPTVADAAFFRANGFLAVERLTTDAELAWLRRIFEFIFDPANAGGPFAPQDRSGRRAAGEPSRLSQAFFPEMTFPEILQSAYRRNARRFAAALLEVDEARLSSWGHMIRKPPGGNAVAWHQDHAYWEPNLDYCAVGVWMPLTDVSVEMGAMQFIPGSHRRGLLRHRHEDDPVHNLLSVDEAFDAGAAVACPLPAGGATFHHAETLHYTAPNATERARLAFPMEFQLAPVRRATPAIMPWMDAHRASLGTKATGAISYVADGRFVKV
jgi:ectoine hydroxylase-related dioxygenase (phytanoyl-CoA dioxygenase family)